MWQRLTKGHQIGNGPLCLNSKELHDFPALPALSHVSLLLYCYLSNLRVCELICIAHE